MRAALAATMSSQRQDWNTPQQVLQLLHAGWPDGVDLDPCSNADSIVEAKRAFTEEDDGLAQPWDVVGHGLIYVNPPFGKPMQAWASKIQQERSQVRNIVTLVPARTDTAWWRVLTKDARYVLFLAGRLKFLGATAGAPFPSALVVHAGFYRKPSDELMYAAQRAGAWVAKP